MDGDSASCYSYLWSEAIDADTVNWISENGRLSRESGGTFRAKLLSRGGSVSDLVGREPDIQPLLERRGLTP